jgi:hypothetical protein
VSKPTCAATTQRGTPCRGIVPLHRAYCLAHDPELAEKVAAARRRGGTVAMKLRHLQGRRLRLDTVPALAKFTSTIVQDVVAGTIEPDVARTALYGVSIQRQLIELADVEARITQLEKAAELVGDAGGRRWA